MTLLVLILGGVLAKLWLVTHGSMIGAGVTVWIALMLATFTTAAIYAWRRGDGSDKWTAGIVLAVLVGRHAGWQTGDPYFWHAFAGIAGGIILAGTANARYQAVISLAMFFQAIVAFLAWRGYLAGSAGRGAGLLASSYPDALAILGHMINVALGINFDGTLRGGKLARSVVSWRGWPRASRPTMARESDADHG